MSGFSFEIKAREGAARTGVVSTPRGMVRTPAFMPVGTQGSVKGLYSSQLRECGVDMILANTYHLVLRPGAGQLAAMGGLHRFMKWPHPVLTDSGGYQVMSLAKLRKLDEEGVTFHSHIDGACHRLTPESAVEAQCLFGSDIIMVLDECTPFPASRQEAALSMRRSMVWAGQSRRYFDSAPHRQEGQALFGIVQGGVYDSLRAESVERLTATGFDGYAIGGLAVGEGQEIMLQVLDGVCPLLTEKAPRYLMGVGTPDDIVQAVWRGIDMFDCVMPTRAGRHGQAFTGEGRINLRNACYADDMRPLDESSSCPAARDYSRAYLHHLMKSGELLGAMVLSWNNVAFYQKLMADIRAAIAESRFKRFVESGAGRLFSAKVSGG
ncbi:MAG: tRNA guanosine(34) transglycosylase Tgt [Parvularculales bacterium]